jgi:hypothetical protein
MLSLSFIPSRCLSFYPSFSFLVVTPPLQQPSTTTGTAISAAFLLVFVYVLLHSISLSSFYPSLSFSLFLTLEATPPLQRHPKPRRQPRQGPQSQRLSCSNLNCLLTPGTQSVSVRLPPAHSIVDPCLYNSVGNELGKGRREVRRYQHRTKRKAK